MIRIVTTLVLVLASFLIPAQNKLEKGMQQAFALMQENKNDEAANILERIATVETENWLPSYHLALLKARTSFSMKDAAKRKAQIAAAEDAIATADALSPNNSEVYVVKGMINTAKIAAEPMTYGPTLSAPTVKLYKKAIALDKTNPRAHSGLAEFEMGSARFFKQDLTPYCKRIQKSIPMYDAFKPKSNLHPNWGKEWALKVIESCGGSVENNVEATSEVNIDVKVTNVLRKGGDVLFILFDSQDAFNNRRPIATQKVPANGSIASTTFEDVKNGIYAIIVLHDMNGNNQMDFESNGMPKEDYGSSNNVMAMGPPNFEDAKFKVENKSVALEIRF